MATETVAIFDTYFCQKTYKNLEIIVPNGQVINKCPKKVPSQHGLNTLKLIDEKIKKKIKVIPVTVFDEKGTQHPRYWRKVFRILKPYKIDYMLMPIGLPHKDGDRIVKHLAKAWNSHQAPTYVAAGQTGNGVMEGVKLWPQELHKHPNLILVGSKFKSADGSIQTPKNQLYAKHIEEFFVLENTQAYAAIFQAPPPRVATVGKRPVSSFVLSLINLKADSYSINSLPRLQSPQIKMHRMNKC